MESINIQHDIIMRLPNELIKLIYEKYNKMIVKKNKKDELTLYKKFDLNILNILSNNL